MPNKKRVSDFIRQAWKRDDHSGWFEDVYANALQGELHVPWARMHTNPLLVEWLDQNDISGNGRAALVIGCGLGDDAEELARRGFDVTAFDISQTAIQWAQQRFTESSVTYLTANLLDPPETWHGTFDFILEDSTLQSLHHDVIESAIGHITSFMKPGGQLLVLCLGREPHEDRSGIPWPLSRAELAAFTANGLTETHFEETHADGPRRFRIEYTR